MTATMGEWVEVPLPLAEVTPRISAKLVRRRRVLAKLARLNSLGNMPKPATFVHQYGESAKLRAWAQLHVRALIDLGMIEEWPTPGGRRLLVTQAGYHEINTWSQTP